MIAEGVGDDVLRRSVGHVPGTGIPGKKGNVGLSAHRDMFFRHLGKLQTGDLIFVTTLDGVFRYQVESTNIVDPDESIVLRDIGRPTLTLVTCYPFRYIGPAPKRFVVHAGLAE
jgi:sortase A